MHIGVSNQSVAFGTMRIVSCPSPRLHFESYTTRHEDCLVLVDCTTLGCVSVQKTGLSSGFKLGCEMLLISTCFLPIQ